MAVPEHTRQVAEAYGIDAVELHRRVQAGLARVAADEAETAKKYRWRRRWRRLINLLSDWSWSSRVRRLRRRRETTLYVSGSDVRAEPLLALLQSRGYYLHSERRFHSYRRFGAEVDACDALLFIGEEAHATEHRALMSLYIAAGHTITLSERSEPLANQPRKRPIFLLELWDRAPNRYASFIEGHPEIVSLDCRTPQAVVQITAALSASFAIA